MSKSAENLGDAGAIRAPVPEKRKFDATPSGNRLRAFLK
jgi:hypothetical protein